MEGNAALQLVQLSLTDPQTAFLPPLRPPRLCASGRAPFGRDSVVHSVCVDGTGCALVAVHLTAALLARHSPVDQRCFAVDACVASQLGPNRLDKH